MTDYLAEMVTKVRTILKDTDESDQRFEDSELEQSVSLAVSDYSQYSLLQTSDTVSTSNGSREIDVSGIDEAANLISVDKLEFPIDETPRVYTPFKRYLLVLTMTKAVGDDNDCRVYYSVMHTLSASVNTIPAPHDDLIALGAAAYAALSEAQFQTDKANFGGENVDRDYLKWGVSMMAEFKARLKRLNRTVKSGKLQVSDD